jgi:hypothetical protein
MSDVDADRTEWIEDYEGLSTDEARDLAHGQGRPVRTLRPGEAMTLDYRPDRLNISLDDNGDLLRLWAG